MSRTCPTPDKTRHATAADASLHAKWLRQNRHASVDLQPYRCVCGVWHVGHSQASLSYRIRDARRKGRA